jgi:beta-alanine degradation protein BauB
MKFRPAFTAALIILPTCLCAQEPIMSNQTKSADPTKTDPDKYHVVFENDRVRVLEYRDQPGDKTTLHAHPDFVLYAVGPFKRRLTSGDGKVVEREFKAGDVIWGMAQAHIGENIGTTETHVMMMELKEPSPQATDRPSVH